MQESIDHVNKAITDFVKGGDNSDVILLDKVLHPDFRVLNNGFMGKSGVAIIDKQKYLDNIRTGVFGGLPREMEIVHVDVSGTIAMVKIKLTSRENDFVSYNSFVLDSDGNWKLINNLAVVKEKKLKIAPPES